MTQSLGYVLALFVLIGLAIIDFNIITYLDLQLQRLMFWFAGIFFRMRLEIDIAMIRLNRWKYERMAKEILSELNSKNNEANAKRTAID